jgi:putative hemolysin
VPLVIMFAELAPLFAARRHPEQAAMTLIPFMMLFSKLLLPFTWAVNALTSALHRLMGKSGELPLFLSRDEVRMAFEKEEGHVSEFDQTAGQIFLLKNLTAAELMMPLQSASLAPSTATLAEARHVLSVHAVPILPIYHRQIHNIVGVIQLRELFGLQEHQKILDAARAPWFVTRDTTVLQLLEQFRRNNQSLAVILGAEGEAIGILTLDQILSEIFGEEPPPIDEPLGYIERTLSGDMSVAEFNRQFSAHLPEGKGDTLSDLLLAELGHLPVKDETLRIQDLEFTVDEPTLMGVKTLSVRTTRD